MDVFFLQLPSGLTNAVGGARMRWLDIPEGHHELSHEPDSNAKAMEKLTKINKWFCEQLAYLAKRLADTPEPGGAGSLLDNTVIVWTNELGKGSSHTLDNIPFVLVGGGLDFKMGRSLKLPKVPHNRLLLALAHGFGPDRGGDRAEPRGRGLRDRPARAAQRRQAVRRDRRRDRPGGDRAVAVRRRRPQPSGLPDLGRPRGGAARAADGARPQVTQPGPPQGGHREPRGPRGDLHAAQAPAARPRSQAPPRLVV